MRESLAQTPVARPAPSRGARPFAVRLIKRVLDLIIASAGLLLASPSPARPAAIPPLPISPARHLTQRLTVYQCLDGPSTSFPELSFIYCSRASVKNSAFITVLAPTPKEPNPYRHPERSLEWTVKNSAFLTVLAPTPKEPNLYGHPALAVVRTLKTQLLSMF